MNRTAVLQRLIDQGAIIADPASVWIDEQVDITSIGAAGTVFSPGCRIIGARTFIGAGARIGEEGPATVQDSFIGPKAEIKAGYCRGAVLLAGACLGAQAHVREGTILEEHASTAHAVGLKQTILFPFVTLGSLINFCDVLMAGGTGRHDHSEVGSSYIHFNFTPHQDKATASLLGDVPAGVMLDQPPIFLGGQGGMVGPCRLGFGTVAAAGTIIRKDEPRCGRLIAGGGTRSLNIAYRSGQIRGLPRIVTNNLIYIGNLIALGCWYRQVRRRFIGPAFPAALHEGLVATLSAAVDERIRRLSELRDRMADATELTADEVGGAARGFVKAWPAVSETLSALKAESFPVPDGAEAFIAHLEEARRSCGNDYVAAIRALEPQVRRLATAWLQSVVDATVTRCLNLVPGFPGHPVSPA